MFSEITIFGLTIGTYILMAVIAAVTCSAMSWRPLRRSGFTGRSTVIMLAAMCVAFLIGARLWNVAVNPDSYGDTKYWYTLKMTGFSMYGGILGSFVVVLAASKICRISPAKTLDALTVPAAIAFCIARVGCFLNGCCGGTKTDLPWGVVFPSSNELFSSALIPIHRYPVHPTQIYELILALIGIPLCMLLVKKFHAGTGGRFYIYGAWFSAMRLCILPMRSLSYPDVVKNNIYPGLYAALIIAGVCLFILACRNGTDRAGQHTITT